MASGVQCVSLVLFHPRYAREEAGRLGACVGLTGSLFFMLMIPRRRLCSRKGSWLTYCLRWDASLGDWGIRDMGGGL